MRGTAVVLFLVATAACSHGTVAEAPFSTHSCVPDGGTLIDTRCTCDLFEASAGAACAPENLGCTDYNGTPKGTCICADAGWYCVVRP